MLRYCLVILVIALAAESAKEKLPLKLKNTATTRHQKETFLGTAASPRTQHITHAEPTTKVPNTLAAAKYGQSESSQKELPAFWSPGTMFLHRTHHFPYLETQKLKSDDFISSLEFVTEIPRFWSEGSHDVVFNFTFEGFRSHQLRRPFWVNRSDKSGFISQQLSVSDLREACAEAKVSCHSLEKIVIYVTTWRGTLDDTVGLAASEVTGTSLVIDMEKPYSGVKSFRSPLTVYGKTQAECTSYHLPYFKVSENTFKAETFEHTINNERYCVTTYSEPQAAKRVLHKIQLIDANNKQ